MESDTSGWATLLCDLLVDIFRRLGSTAVIRCAGVCRPWRRAIIDNARRLRPRPDRFLPDLLLGFLHQKRDAHRCAALQYLPGPFQNVLTTDAADATVRFLTPAATACGIDVVLYDAPLSLPRDGFLLLGGSSVHDLCLCNPLTGSCRFLPAAEFGAASGQSSCIMYVLATWYDDSPCDGDGGGGGGESAGVWMLAVETAHDLSGGMTYRIFSSTSGACAWGPIKCSAKLWNEDQLTKAYTNNVPKDVVICHGAIYWLVLSIPVDYLWGQRWCALAMDMRTERTWIMELPMKHAPGSHSLMLAASEDGQLSLIMSMPVINQINVWVLTGKSQWMLQREIDAQNWLPAACCPKVVRLRAFCPRSGCMLVCVDGQDLLVAVGSSSPQAMATTRLVDDGKVVDAFRYPYEMDWSSYISEMKYF